MIMKIIITCSPTPDKTGRRQACKLWWTLVRLCPGTAVRHVHSECQQHMTRQMQPNHWLHEHRSPPTHTFLKLHQKLRKCI